jgi:hypothetical protein
MKDVKRAGEMIAGELPWTPESQPTIREAFQIANSWRDSQAYSMRSIRYQLIWFMRHHGLALLWQIYSSCMFAQVHFRQCGHRCGGSRVMSATMA